MDLAVAGAEELAERINTSKGSAASFIISIQNLLRDSKVIKNESALEKNQWVAVPQVPRPLTISSLEE
jgi:hypothetical protein